LGSDEKLEKDSQGGERRREPNAVTRNGLGMKRRNGL
jgi:hypothetical protein